jgi:hypothetical protein
MLPAWDAGFHGLRTRDCCFVVRCLSLFFQCWKCIILGKKYIFPKRLYKSRIGFKKEIRKIKTRDIHNYKKGIHKRYFQTTLSIFEVDNPWRHI